MTGPWKQEERTLKTALKEQWPFVLALFAIQIFAFGFPTFALPFIYSGATQEFGWTRQQAVLLASFKFYTSAGAALVAGRMLDAINAKYVIAISAVLGALAMTGFMVAKNLAVYYALGVILGLNASGLAIAINVTVSRTFAQSTGAILGIVLSGTSVAGMLLPMLMAPLMNRVGWRTAMVVLSCGIWLVALPAWFLISRHPNPSNEPTRSRSLSAARVRMRDHFKGLAATRDFWFIFIGAFLVAAVDQALIQNQVLFLQSDKGLSLQMAAWGTALLAAAGIGAKICFGWIFDRLSIAGIVLCYLLLAVSIGLSFSVVGITTMLIFVAVLGIAHGGVIVTGPVLLKHRYGTQNLGINLGIFTLCSSLGFGFGPPFMAKMADKSGSYSGAFAIGIAAVLIAAIFLYPIKPKFCVPRIARIDP